MTYDRHPVRKWMTPLPHMIEDTQLALEARRRLRSLGVRHLPVISRERAIVGVLSEADMRHLDPRSTASVRDVMTRDPLSVGPEMPIAAVARTMARAKVECALVVEDGEVRGILTCTDALHLLADVLLLSAPPKALSPRPAWVRERVLGEHEVLRGMLTSLEALATRVLDGDARVLGELRAASSELYQTMLRHIELEETLLVPALREADSFGAVRAVDLHAEHDHQREALFDALMVAPLEGVELAQSAVRIAAELRTHMAHEERELVSDEVLRDGLVSIDFTG